MIKVLENIEDMYVHKWLMEKIIEKKAFSIKDIKLFIKNDILNFKDILERYKYNLDIDSLYNDDKHLIQENLNIDTKIQLFNEAITIIAFAFKWSKRDIEDMRWSEFEWYYKQAVKLMSKD